MPAIVPRTSTFALTNATFSYALELANKGFRRAVRENAALKRGVNICRGAITQEGVAGAFGAEHVAIEDLL
jgi:alanine dehydrogenase